MCRRLVAASVEEHDGYGNSERTDRRDPPRRLEQGRVTPTDDAGRLRGHNSSR
jgi:hypothetical protein